MRAAAGVRRSGVRPATDCASGLAGGAARFRSGVLGDLAGVRDVLGTGARVDCPSRGSCRLCAFSGLRCDALKRSRSADAPRAWDCDWPRGRSRTDAPSGRLLGVRVCGESTGGAAGEAGSGLPCRTWARSDVSSSAFLDGDWVRRATYLEFRKHILERENLHLFALDLALDLAQLRVLREARPHRLAFLLARRRLLLGLFDRRRVPSDMALHLAVAFQEHADVLACARCIMAGSVAQRTSSA